MIIKTLYRYTLNNTVVDSCIQPDCTFIERCRLIAEDGKVLTQDDISFVTVIDIDKVAVDSWREVDPPEEPNDVISTEIQNRLALMQQQQ